MLTIKEGFNKNNISLLRKNQVCGEKDRNLFSITVASGIIQVLNADEESMREDTDPVTH
jgi:hypothetical protein